MAIFDYIIIGAGSAGCVLADRLTASGKHQVLLIEAGGDDRRFWVKMPLGYGKTFTDPSLNWCYTAEADPGLQGRRSFWPRGKVLGGSSSINAMVYLRGLPHDFDDWERAGADGWGWDQVRTTYDALETHDEPGPTGTRHRRGNGPVWVRDANGATHPFCRHFLTGAQQAGWQSGATGEALARLRTTVKNGQRWSAADAFLRPALKRTNLKLASNALVERITFERLAARKVHYRQTGRTFYAEARREIIVSAGAINSPQLLLLSGVGPADEMLRHGISIVADLPEVGRGLQDHLAISYAFRANEPTLNSDLGTRWKQMIAGLRYVLTRKGPLSVPANQIGGFVCSGPDGPADMQIYGNPLSYTLRADGYASASADPGFLISAQPTRPTSRGEIRLRSADPGEPPEIHPNSLSTNRDVHQAVAAGRLVQKLANAPSIKAATKDGPDIAAMSDADLLTDFRARANTVFHPSCTCRMGRDKTNSVLDSRLKVHGIERLRVVDASAFPNITSGNINAPVMMLADRAATMILEDAQ